MTDFEFLFSLYGLLLGFSLVVVLGGLARTFEAWVEPAAQQSGDAPAPAGRRGYLAPLLGLFVMLDLLSFWAAAWAVRDMVSVSPRMLMAVLLFSSSYYLAAHLVFPREAPSYRDLDRHYFHVRRLVVGILLGLLAVQLLFYMSEPVMRAAISRPVSIAATAILAALMVALMAVRGARANAAILVLLLLRYLWAYLR
jgi:hypothetical protein